MINRYANEETLNGLPIELRRTHEDDYEKAFVQASELLFVGDFQFVGAIAKQMGFPHMFDYCLCLHQYVGELLCEHRGELKKMPICAEIRFYRRPQDNGIIALSSCVSLVSHADIYEEGVRKLFKKNKNIKVQTDHSTEFAFQHWSEERVGNWQRRDKIDNLLQ